LSGEVCYDKRYLAYISLAGLLILVFFIFSSVLRPRLPKASNVAEGPFPGFPVDVNSADANSLMLLPGIGPKRAEAIMTERESRGGFTSLEALREASGVSTERFEAIKKYILIKKSGDTSAAAN